MLLQILINGIISGSVYLLLAIGFALIYFTSRFFHFSHAIVFTMGAYCAFLSKVWLNLSLWAAILLSIVCCVIFGCLMDILVYRPLRRKNASSMILLLASLGIYIALQNVISMAFGDDTKTIRTGEIKEGLNFLGARITPIQIIIIIVSILLVGIILLFLKELKIGKAMRAVANDSELAEMSGVNSDRVILCTFIIGSALAGGAGILVALDVDMTPTMGMNALMMAVVAAIIGGVGSISGVALGALLLGMAQHLGAWKLSSQWQDAIAFIILFIFLLFNPEGFLGKKIKKMRI